MKVEILNYVDRWEEVKDAALTTVGKNNGKYPSRQWKKKILLAEHSPIRLLTYTIRFTDIPYFIVMHFTRHCIGTIHFVKSQREDRSETHAKRSDLPQDAPVDYEMVANAQALINISRKRLCNQAAKETREAWKEAVDLISKADPVVGSVLHRECVYRGFCPEPHCCGYVYTANYIKELEEYRKVDK